VRETIPGALIYGDVSGKIAIPSIRGSLYYILYKDDATAFHFIHFAKAKSEALPFFKRVVKQIKKDIGHNVLRFYSDRRTEFYNEDFDSFFEEKVISHDTSMAYTP
jgi:hypothetical protein